METLPIAVHTPGFRTSLAQSALPDAPVVPDAVRAPRRGLIRSLRAALSGVLPWAAEAAAPSSQDKRGVWRISEDDLQAFLDTAYQETAERMAAGDVDEVPGADGESSP